MTTADFNLMSKIFAAEIAGASDGIGLYQGRAKRLKELEADGMIEEAEIVGRFPVRVKGWQHTTRGNIIYCEECSRRWRQWKR